MAKKYDVLDASQNMSFHSIYEAINDCMGTDYTGWMKACWPASMGDMKFRMWFPKLAKNKNGEKVSAAFDCVNTISDDWNQVVFEDLKRAPNGEKNPSEIYRGLDLIFAKDPNGGYLFRGCFIYDDEMSKGNRFVSKRIASKVKLIGDPVTDIEPLDEIGYADSGDINTPLQPKGLSADGYVVICPRCDTKFKRAERCPECGQLIKYQEG